MTTSRAGTLIRQARHLRHMSQRDVAAMTGTTQSAISRMENGASVPSYDRVLDVLAVMGLDVDVQLELVEVDEAALSRNLRLDAPTRLKNAVRAAQFVLSARRAMAGSGL
jgi:transcriptional regulator with XRE-family HTH domain